MRLNIDQYSNKFSDPEFQLGLSGIGGLLGILILFNAIFFYCFKFESGVLAILFFSFLPVLYRLLKEKCRLDRVKDKVKISENDTIKLNALQVQMKEIQDALEERK